ncbi:MAG: acylphosphatase [Opitutales bacterium]|nr:acylphosphatase [Opitutales bacterium]
MQVFHKKVSFKGRVQGVGFRYQTLQVARGFDVSGYIRNEMDGSVTLEAEGERDEVNAFVDEVVLEMRSYIKEFDESTDQRTSQYSGFRIG